MHNSMHGLHGTYGLNPTSIFKTIMPFIPWLLGPKTAIVVAYVYLAHLNADIQNEKASSTMHKFNILWLK